MSGHSKWNNIKNKKAAQDSKKGKSFSIISRQIRVAVKEGKSGDPEQNPTLRLALEKARQANMPKENVSRAIEKGLGKSATGKVIEEVVYEGYGPGGVGFMVLVVTDNRNRSGAEVRSLFEQAEGSLGVPGSTAYLFTMDHSGQRQVKVPLPVIDPKIKERVNRLIEALEELDDVDLVETNMV